MDPVTGIVLLIVVVLMLGTCGCSSEQTAGEEGGSGGGESGSTETDIETATEEEVMEATEAAEDEEDWEATTESEVCCTNALSEDDVLHVRKTDGNVYTNDIETLIKTDIELDGTFECCTVTGGECSVIKEDIEGQVWQMVNEGDDEGEDKEKVSLVYSYMFCTKHYGIIYFKGNQQQVIGYETEILQDVKEKEFSDNGKEILRNLELGAEYAYACGVGMLNTDGEMIGIYPHYVFRKNKDTGEYESDGGITLGYGHWVSQDDYNDNEGERSLIDTYITNPVFIPPYIPDNGLPYRVSGSQMMPIEDANQLFEEDIVIFQSNLNDFLIAEEIHLNQNQFDACIIYAYQHGENCWYNTKLQFPKLLYNSKGNYDPDDIKDLLETQPEVERRTAEIELFNYGY